MFIVTISYTSTIMRTIIKFLASVLQILNPKKTSNISTHVKNISLLIH